MLGRQLSLSLSHVVIVAAAILRITAGFTTLFFPLVLMFYHVPSARAQLQFQSCSKIIDSLKINMVISIMRGINKPPPNFPS